MTVSRRDFMRASLGSALSLTAGRAFAQGMGGHAAKPMARQAPSGRPFNAHFTDVAAAAGLHAPTIYGGDQVNKYILESNGCGCAFIDYDNDGWMDIFLLSRHACSRAPRRAPPTASTKTIAMAHSPTSPKRPACTPPAGPMASASATTTTTASTTFSAPTSAKTCSIATTATAHSPMSRKPPACRTSSRAGAPAAASSTTTATAISILFVSNYVDFDLAKAPGPRRQFQLQLEGVPVDCGPRGLPTGTIRSTTTTATALSPTSAKQAGIAQVTR